MNLLRVLRAVLISGATFSAQVWAGDLNSLQLLGQSEFKLLSQDLGATLSYKGLVPAEPLGITGFDLGAAVTVTSLKNTQLWERASSGSDVPSGVPVPSVRAYKGLPLNIDVGLTYLAVPSTNIKMWGGELRWAVLAGNAALPAVALRLSATRLQGVEQLKLNTEGIDISLSKGFALATPYRAPAWCV